MVGRTFDDGERAQLCVLMSELGPDAPTLLSPWTTRDLAAHPAIRERRPAAAPGLVLPGAWGRYAERCRVELARTDYDTLLETVRAGPPPGFFRLGWVRRVPNLNELFVHHEDVRRANGALPRTSEPGLDQALWHNACAGAWFLTRRLRGIGLELEWSETAEVRRVRRGRPTVRVVGPPGELLLHLFGRRDAAVVELRGPEDAVEIVEATHFGM